MIQILIALSGMAALLMAFSSNARAEKWAPIVGLAGQPAWLYAAWSAGQWGMLLVSVGYTVTWAIGVRVKWRVR